MRRHHPPLCVVVLATLSIGMGLMADHAAAHQIISVNPHLYCGQSVTCHE